MRTDHEVGGDVARVRVSTALGGFDVRATARGLRAVTPLRRDDSGRVRPYQAGPTHGRPGEDAWGHARAAAEALLRYAEGERVRYEGTLDVTGPEFQLAVWERLRAIPFGATTTYGEIAAALGLPAEARAVGVAVGANPVCVLVPCHRVVGADGSLRGFAWGLALKRRLLAHEGSVALPLFADALGS